ncbi:response regulator [Kovacikia minuta CCNUW1]|uniref:response regulator n=1 Tax=Kovacikia minuta TaxID=2931930 RepID=UPI001CCF16A6|nr:response regulator [Kovacikia minuta]UBF26918.1 response regulator [Kovacikia minuta CCNUW1]
MNILLIDDDELLARGTAKLIQRLGGHQVFITDNPTEIFRTCQAGNIDVILMDVNLPGAEWEGRQVSGADLAHALKADPQTAHLPIILVTAYAMLGERKAFLEASQADAFFAKPITDYLALLETIDRLVQESDRSKQG